MSVRNMAEVLKNGVIYQINLRAFTPEGTLRAAEKLLPHIRSIGVDIVYLCACSTADRDEDRAGWSDRQRASGMNNPCNPYRISDYDAIDPEYGDMEDMRRFVETAHGVGLRVLLDLVYFHCGPNAVFLAEHPDFIVRNPDGTPALGSWRFPQLNFELPALREYLMRNMEFFVRDCGVDGYRCDVGDAVPLDFWSEACARIDALKPGLVMINEGVDAAYLDVFDLNYGWYLREAFLACVEGKQPAEVIAETQIKYSKEHLQGTWRSIALLENHDTVSDDYDNRMEQRIGKLAMDAVLVINYTLPNVPFLYCGTEVCDTNRHSLWGNRFHGANLVIDWQNALTADGVDRMALLRLLAQLRHSIPALGMDGALAFAKTGNAQVLGYFREKAGQRCLVAVNLSDEKAYSTVAAEASAAEALLARDVEAELNEGNVNLALEPWGFALMELK